MLLSYHSRILGKMVKNEDDSLRATVRLGQTLTNAIQLTDVIISLATSARAHICATFRRPTRVAVHLRRTIIDNRFSPSPSVHPLIALRFEIVKRNPCHKYCTPFRSPFFPSTLTGSRHSCNKVAAQLNRTECIVWWRPLAALVIWYEPERPRTKWQ